MRRRGEQHRYDLTGLLLLTIIVSMRTVGITELKATLSEKLAVVKAGGELVVTERGRPVARIIPYEPMDSPERLEALERQGIVTLPRRKATRREPRVSDPEGLALAALLAERDEGR